MSIYAVIKVGAAQQRVSVGDTLEVPHNFPEEAIEPIFMGSSKGGIKADKDLSLIHISEPTRPY